MKTLFTDPTAIGQSDWTLLSFALAVFALFLLAGLLAKVTTPTRTR